MEGNRITKYLSLKTVENIGIINSRITHKFELITALYVVLIWISLGVPILKGEQSFSAVVGSSVFITLIILFLLLKKENFILYRIKRVYFVLFEIIGLSFLFNGVYYSVVGYIVIGSTFSLIIPLFSLISYNFVEFSICKALSVAVIVTFVIFLVISVVCGPSLGVKQYTSIFSNPNTLGNFMIIVNGSILYLILNAYSQKSRYTWMYFFALGAELTIMVFTNSRTTLLAVVLQLLFFIVVCIVRTIKENDGYKIADLVKRFVLATIIVIVMFMVVFFALTSVKKELIYAAPSIQVQNEYEQISLKEVVTLTYLRYTKGLSEVGFNGDESADNDAFTSGRKEIWKQFVSNLEVLGHKEESRKIVEDTRYYASTNAHNVYIQMAYSAGIAAGVAMILIILVAVKDAIIKIYTFFKNGQLSDDYAFAICCSIGFGIVSLTSGGYMMFTYLPATMFYFTFSLFCIEKKQSLR